MMRLITVHVPEAILEALDALVLLRIYPNRSEAIRDGMRLILKNEGGIRYLLEVTSKDTIVIAPKV